VAEKSKHERDVNHAVKSSGQRKLQSGRRRGSSTGELKEWKYDGVFVFSGWPHSDLVKGKVELDP